MSTHTLPAQTAAVHYTLEVIEADGTTRLAQPRKKNLILDQGLDVFGFSYWDENVSRVACGTGTTPTKRDSGTITFSRASATVTASAGFFAMDDVGRLLKFDTGEEMYIIGHTSATVVTVGTSGTLPSAEGTIWYVNQTGLFAEVNRVDTTFTGQSYLAGTWTLGFVAIFPVVGATTAIREIGWINNRGGNILFGRDLLAGSGVTLLAGQQLRVTVELAVTIGPMTAQPYTNVVTGWASNGQQMLVGYGSYPIFPYYNMIWATTDTTAITARTHADSVDIVATVGYLARVPLNNYPYTPGSFTVVKEGSFGPSLFNSNAVRSIYAGFYFNQNDINKGLFRIRLDSPEAKSATQSLTFSLIFTWSRVLTN